MKEMAKEKMILGTEIFVDVFMFVLIIIGMILGWQGQAEFYSYVPEDGFIENMTVLFLLATVGVAIYRVFKYRKSSPKLWIFTYVMIAILFFFAAGEEISWGQRIFGIESTDFFLSNNDQHETNFHNLVVYGVDLNILIFSKMMFIVLISYFFIVPILVRKVLWVARLESKFNVPLPKIRHIVVMLVATLMVVSISRVKASELHEVSFAMIFFTIMLSPMPLSEAKKIE